MLHIQRNLVCLIVWTLQNDVLGFSPIQEFLCYTVSFSGCIRHNEVTLHYRSRIGCFKQEDKEKYEASKSKDIPDTQVRFTNEAQVNGKDGNNKMEIPFRAMIAIALGIAVTATIASIAQNPIGGSSFGLQILSEGSSSSAVVPATAGFTFKAFGYRVMLPEYAPGYPLLP